MRDSPLTAREGGKGSRGRAEEGWDHDLSSAYLQKVMAEIEPGICENQGYVREVMGP